ncbi:nuclear factor of activated T-cells, cytoplasmic 3-like [Xiphophorus maculatus]|uniref:Nuclear factor of activated T cells 3b n=1 Tax=Xiphophorus maculatus TaxID=8083 RepID=M4ACV3_XIPMA|nr:nuclear factor of activated T-cells, cytoplasmic 3-like [Xiphophorus maculatus]
MSTTKSAEELDFRLLFEEHGKHSTALALDVKTSPSTQALTEQLCSPELQSHLPCLPGTVDYDHADGLSHGPYCGLQQNFRAFDCPSIEITSIAHNHIEPGNDLEVLPLGGAEGGYPEPLWTRDQLYLPLDACYRETALSQSPCSSLSSRSWMSDLSSCESFSHGYDDVEGELQDPALLALGSPGCRGGAFGVELWQQKYQHPSAFNPVLSPYQSPRQSPCHSPRTSVTEENWLSRRPTSRPSSRPTSPCGKRRHSGAEPHARSPSPHHSPSPTPGTSPRGSVTDDTWVGSPASALGSLLISGCQELDVPSKTRRTTGSHLGLLIGQGEPGLDTYQDSPSEEVKEKPGLAELYLQVPSHYSWAKPKPGNAPLFRGLSPPPLDWPLPNQYDLIELKLEVQPRSYHRAHYETEGSRGSIKATTGGHPVVKLIGYSEQPVHLLVFIGTADDRYLRPHSFYQVHRVTGKTVNTVCQEKIMSGTKVLEIPLLPGSNMCASIDCAGILKLRNADIELKKGETDIGRKNTRVRVVFRVAVPQQDGQMLWLQTESIPVECSQRSGQELPQVESFSPTSCFVDGGEELLITGTNMSAQSRVVFVEKGPDGRPQWEVDARVLSDKSNESRITVEIPPYVKRTASPAQVQFYVSNGKRRRSLMQSFTYLPGIRGPHQAAPAVKQELWGSQHIFCPEPSLSPSHDAVLRPDVAYDPYNLPLHGLPSQNSSHLHHPPAITRSLEASLLLPQMSSAPCQIMTPLPNQGLTSVQIGTIDAQAPSPPIQTLNLSHHTSAGGPPRKQSESSKSTLKSSLDAHKDFLLHNPGEVLSVKKEPEEQPILGSLGFQEITLDDVNEIIDRDIGTLSSCVQTDQHDQFQQYTWEHSSSSPSGPFHGDPQ